MRTFSRSIGLTPRIPLGGMVALIAALYLAREFIIPIVLAALIAFSLSPVVRWLERRRIPRMISVLSVCFSVAFLLLSIAWIVVSQMTDFAGQLPHYRTNLLSKVEQLKSDSHGPWWGAAMTISEVASSLEETANKVVPSSGNTDVAVMPVQVVQANQNAMTEMGLGIASVAGPFGTLAVVGILIIFMLLARDNLRDRMVHLAGKGRLRVTHQAMAESGRRVSRYLLAQTVVNAIYGAMVWISMAVIGVPNAPLWGLVGFVIRYVPYMGPVIAFVLPFAVSLAVAPTWAIPLWVIGVFVVIEIIVNNVLEPYFFSSSTGLSPLAVIVSSLFWAWLWGPMGLVLATPLTVCASVMGKEIKALSFLHVLLSDEPPITPAERFYQRLVADNGDEALKIISETREESTLTEALDDFALPAVVKVHAAVDEGDLDLEIEERAFRSLHRILPKIETAFEEEGAAARAEIATPPDGPARVVIVPVANDADTVVGELLECALREKKIPTAIMKHELLRSEKADLVCAGDAGIVVLVSTTEDSARAARMLSRSISRDRSDIKIHTLLSLPDPEKQIKWDEQLTRAGVHDVSSSLITGVKNVRAWLTMLPPLQDPKVVTISATLVEVNAAA